MSNERARQLLFLLYKAEGHCGMVAGIMSTLCLSANLFKNLNRGLRTISNVAESNAHDRGLQPITAETKGGTTESDSKKPSLHLRKGVRLMEEKKQTAPKVPAGTQEAEIPEAQKWESVSHRPGGDITPKSIMAERDLTASLFGECHSVGSQERTFLQRLADWFKTRG
jgi:hypothetical protein